MSQGLLNWDNTSSLFGNDNFSLYTCFVLLNAELLDNTLTTPSPSDMNSDTLNVSKDILNLATQFAHQSSLKQQSD